MAPKHSATSTYQVNHWFGFGFISFLAISIQSDQQEMRCLVCNRISSATIGFHYLDNACNRLYLLNLTA